MATIKLKDYLKSQHKSYISHKIERDSFIVYLKNLDIAYTKIKDASKSNATEENIKNIFADFLKNTFYKNISGIEINTFDNIDYAIKKDGNIEVIMEFKKPSNKAEMIIIDPKTNTYNLNKKALHEAIKYFYDEKHKGNYHIKNIIISDGLSFFIFNATQFQNKNLEKLCYDAIKGDLYLQNTKDIYQAISDEIGRNQISFDYAWFDLGYLEKRIKNFDLNNVDINDKAIRTLLYLYKLLHPDFLLNQYSPKDSNQLNKKFYDELLYILGLEEVSEGSKRLIQPNDKGQGLINETIYQLKEQKNVFNQDDAISIAFELVITWLNRILFLKLFEAQLIAFNNDKSFSFITSDKISNFDDLNHLFFAVLGKKHQERQNQEQTQHIPYLNSSLFELSDVEAKYFSITALHEKNKLEVLKSSNLKKWSEYKNKSEEQILKYLLDFLDSYDFSSEANNNLITEENKDIINSAVLGLIFEKLNGYKDGSFYTPGFITEYMAKESIERAVITKFNETLKIEAKDVNELKSYIGRVYKKEDFIEYNNIVNSLKILDPAVGSGHFLVSVLNQIIYLKSYLGILWDGEAKVENSIDIFDDTLIVFTENDTPFTYKKADKNTHVLQKTLFNEKKTIVENCLFAVDINPKSVYICQLRLWIELLKNTYYINDSYEMDVLPNIDINIKAGNSLISKFPINIGKSAIADNKKLKEDIKDYKKAVSEYKSSGDKQTKQRVKNKIGEIKKQLFSAAQYDLFSCNKKLIDENIYKNSMEWMIEFPEVLNEKGEFQGFDVVIGNPPYISHDKLAKQEKDFYKSYYKSFAPFADIYCYFLELSIKLQSNKGVLTQITSNSYLKAEYGANLRNFIGNNNSVVSIINIEEFQVFESATVNTVILVSTKDAYSQPIQIINSSLKTDIMFKDFIEKQTFFYSKDDLLCSSSWSLMQPNQLIIKNKMDSIGASLETLETKIRLGIATGDNNAFVIDENQRNILIQEDFRNIEIIKPILRGRDIKKYYFLQPNLYVLLTKNEIDVKTQYPSIYHYLDGFGDKFKKRGAKGKHWSNLRACSFFDDFSLEKIIWIELTDKGKFALSSDEIYLLNSAYFMLPPKELKAKYLLAILNSKIIKFYLNLIAETSGVGTTRWINNYVKEFPIPCVEYVIQNKFIEIVEEILRLTNTQDYEQNEESQNKVKELEAEIDQLVYKLYDLTEDEVKIVEAL